MERPGDESATWGFNFTAPDGTREDVSVRDVVRVHKDVPTHDGLEILVELTATSVNSAADRALQIAESVLILLAAAARAPVGSAQLMLTYDITPDVDERAFAQWFPDVPITFGKHPVPRAVFGRLWDDINRRQDQRFAWRLMLSMSWHRIALDEVDAVRRFLTLWIALEALAPLLADEFDVDPRGFGGLRALADVSEAPEELITQALGLRRDLFHARRVTYQDLAARATVATPELEKLLVAGWTRLLAMDDVADQFRFASIVPWPTRLVLRATLLHKDQSVWGHGYHPHFDGVVDQRREDIGDPREVRIGLDPKLTLRNAGATRGATKRHESGRETAPSQRP
jgi:hypothetical protein